MNDSRKGMSRIISVNDPYKPSMASKLDDLVLNTKPMLKAPVFIQQYKGIEKL